MMLPRERFTHRVTLAAHRSRTSQYHAARQWCEDRFGARDVWGDEKARWTVFAHYNDGSNPVYEFAFLDHREAFEFKLRWT